ncbi:MAG: type IV secretory pathway VirB10-like protein [Candidatus Deianiraeaceae bacterium]|jgi:type IV secretory pathway VirB10-like protein
MSDENNNNSLDDDLENALKDFEDSGGFSGEPPPRKNQEQEENTQSDTNSDEDEGFDEFLIDAEFDDTEKETYNNEDEEGELIDDDDLIEEEDDAMEGHTDNIQSKNIDDGNNKDRLSVITSKLKEPKNAIILVVAICFLLFLLLKSNSHKKKRISYQSPSEVHEEVLSDVSDSRKEEHITTTTSNDIPSSQLPNITLQDIELPNLNINLPNIDKSNIDLIPKIPKPKDPQKQKLHAELERQLEEAAMNTCSDAFDAESCKKDFKIRNRDEFLIKIKKQMDKKALQAKNTDDIKIPEIQTIEIINNIKEKTKKEDEKMPKVEGVDELSPDKIIRKRITDKTDLSPLVQDFGGTDIIPKKSSKKGGNDFIFIDSDLDTEISTDVISATRLESPENVVSQGRIIDAVLETAINSTIGGQVRAIVVKDVYAEVGRNILIPKGTRMYGEYGSSGSTSDGGRIVITWTRIMRPDNISATINSFASDQFGRSGIQGDVEKKYFSGVTSAILLSAIPLLTTIATNAITNQQPQSTTVGTTGAQTVVRDPINVATGSFTAQVSQITKDIITDAIDTKPTITLNQGTRIKVLINQDIKLPAYSPITKHSSSASGSGGGAK